MQKISIKSNKQCSINLPKELLEAVEWTEGDRILISKVPGQKTILIENISQEKKNR